MSEKPEPVGELPVMNQVAMDAVNESIATQAVIKSSEGNEDDLLAQETQYWKDKSQSLMANLLFLTIGLLLMTLVLAAIKALLQEPNFFAAMAWLFTIPAITVAISSDFATILAPLVSISVAIERLLETIFDYLERGMYNMEDLLKTGEKTMGWIGMVYRNAYDNLRAASRAVQNNPKDKAAMATFEDAKKAFAAAEEKIHGYLESPQYKNWKRYLTLMGAFIMGLVIAVWADLGMLRMIGITVPRFFDMVLTGLVIGSGSGPMHSLIGILQGGKDALDGFRQNSQLDAIRKAKEEIKKELENIQS